MALRFENSNCLKMDELSPHVWSAPGVPLETAAPSQRSQAPEEHVSQQEGHVQIMYCKDQVYQGDAEFSLEELRAQRYYKALSEKALHLNKLKQDLQLQIEQKKRLLQQRNSSTETPQIVHEEASSSFQNSSGSCESAVVRSAPFTVYSDQEEDRVLNSKSSVRREDDMNHRGSDAKLQKTAKPFSVSDENTLTNKTSTSANRNSLKLPTLSLKGPKPKADLSAVKDVSISRSEDAIINGHWNKTLCRSPDDTCEFARAAQLASTPFGGVQRPGASESGLMENKSQTAPESSKATNSNGSAPEKKLSPILEISQEWGGSSFASFSQDPVKRCKEREVGGAVERAETLLEEVSESEQVCGLGVRSRLYHQADVSCFCNLQLNSSGLPDASGVDDLCLDGEVLVYRRTLETLEDFTLYSSGDAAVFLKVERSGVPWDFFISSQLRCRRSGDEPKRDVQICCHVFEDGCLTLWRIPHGETLQDLLAEPVAPDDVSLIVVLLLELVKEFHSCRVVHGGLKPESLYFYHTGITALDFSDSVDLQLQTDVTTARDLPSAQKYIQQGLLSPSDSPYHVDLIGVAEVVHMLLFNRPMKVTQENSAWSLDEGSGSQHTVPVEALWKDFFHMILNPEGKSPELVLSELIRNVKND
ncbi:mitotic checkpoint serine/threonine-protein kinase BUB1 beta isoform X2 [Carassius gibelio]|uniref:mitotic checkpoint serine/threonine-protein kinase BUB1 beta isoform X2 n=1 Tax=Carassius gibelio TaxID=101364 RepID=UPI0022795EA4|nr:mitotic checkpoint serine/threonine-protein kinase BUB1 beta isoform X2 [Carassius gibelio]XP_052391997.1 mitotic checkpoint serine/threonine-protein kinase BUB1 beta isoform X2 [Carassius gibelio]